MIIQSLYRFKQSLWLAKYNNYNMKQRSKAESEF